MSDVTELEDLRRLHELELKAAGAPAPAVSAEPSVMDRIAELVPDSVKNIGTAAYKGVAGLAAGAADALAGSHDAADYVGSAASGKPLRPLDESSPITRSLEETGYQPKTTAEKFTNAGVRGATAALLSPQGLVSPVKNAIIGGLAGLGSQGGTQVFHDTSAGPYAAIVGALLGGSVGAIGTSQFTNAQALAREGLQGIPEGQLAAARATMERGQKVGVPVNLDQALGHDTNITNVVKALVSRKEGQPLVDQLRAQPEQVRSLAERLQESLPGAVKEPAVIANESQGAATDVMKAARNARTAATQPLYSSAGDLDPEFVQGLHQQVTKLAEQFPDTNKGALLSEIGDVIKGHLDRAEGTATGLLDSMGNPIPATPLPVSAEKLNDSLRSFTTNLKSVHTNSKSGDREAVGAAQSIVKDIRDQIGDVSPNFKAANELHADISSQVVDPLKKGVIGRVMGLTGEQADKEAVNKLLPILAKGRDPKADTSEILQFADQTKDTPEVFQNAVKTHFSQVIATAEKQLHGQLNPNLAQGIESGLLGTAQKRQGWKDALTGIATQQGAEPNTLYKGFMNGMKIIGAVAKRPGALGPDDAALSAIAGDSKIASGAKMIGLAPGKPVGRGIEGILSGHAYRTLAENLTTPEGVKKLQELAKVDYLSPKAQAIMSMLLATEATKVATPPGVQQSNTGDLGE